MSATALNLNEKSFRERKIVKELLNGVITLMSPPRPQAPHVESSGGIFGEIRQYLKRKTCKVFSEIDVFLTEKDNFVPDISIVCDLNKIKKNGIHGAPDMVVEILSQSTSKKDRGYKKDVYEASGVKEYWIVDPLNRFIDVFLSKDGKFVLDETYVHYREEDFADLTDDERKDHKTEIKVSIFDDLVITLEDIFGDLMEF
ncbi:MAG: Uma2 family endonuclease [Defluviitaleaceae bacterium]|nr:Uma2 family endonuclease [Defluviitaleaceae bacterium]